MITIKLTLAEKIRYLNILSGQLFQIGGTESILKKHKEVVEIKSRVSKISVIQVQGFGLVSSLPC